jgi:hypothetical protein
MPDFHPSSSVIRELHERYPQTPFLTLGQTVLWDEPVKAAFCRMLEVMAPNAVMVAAVHDTDYFAKLPRLEGETQSREKFVLLPHNDGDTRGLWSAAGEISSLFGSESVPTRHALTENGVEFDRVARDFPGGAGELLNQETGAWGWRALVQTDTRPMIAGDVKLRDIGPALISQIEWAINESLQIAWPQDSGICETCAEQAQENAAKIFAWTRDYLNENAESTLSDFYRWLTPRLWALVRGEGSCNLTTGTSLRLFQFNRQTCQLPRFAFVDLFINPATREIAGRCYNEAVRGSGIYTLDQFRPGALPFDVIIPGQGRGTLHLHEGTLTIDTEPRRSIQSECESIEQLAQILEDNFGPQVALVGKAVSLISMLAHEFIFVFHEKASSYTTRTQKMHELMRKEGIELNLHPMLRLKYATWDALSQARAVFNLPPHLEAAFGQKAIPAGEFAARWGDVCQSQDALRSELKGCRSPRELMNLLAARFGGEWTKRRDEFDTAHAIISALHEKTVNLKNEIDTLRHEADCAIGGAAQIERLKGDDFRTYLNPLRQRLFDIKELQARRAGTVELDAVTGKQRKLSKEEREAARLELENENQEIETLRQQITEQQSKRQEFDEQIEESRGLARERRALAKQKVREKLALERSPEVVKARQARRELHYEAELERLRRTRDAIIVGEGLRYTNYRPTAWWFPLVSPDGKWFDALVESAQARIEEV